MVASTIQTHERFEGVPSCRITSPGGVGTSDTVRLEVSTLWCVARVPVIEFLVIIQCVQ